MCRNADLIFVFFLSRAEAMYQSLRTTYGGNFCYMVQFKGITGDDNANETNDHRDLWKDFVERKIEIVRDFLKEIVEIILTFGIYSSSLTGMTWMILLLIMKMLIWTS